MQLSCQVADEFRLENKDNNKTRKAPSTKLVNRVEGTQTKD
jgi:hypothetical protein